MPTKIEITCDGCGADLTYTSNCEDYYLVLANQSKAPWYAKEGHRGGVLTSMAIAPKIDHEYCFCDLMCLDHWRSRRHYFEALEMKAFNEWKERYGYRDVSGVISGWVPQPHDAVVAQRAEYQAAALAAFPMDRRAAKRRAD